MLLQLLLLLLLLCYLLIYKEPLLIGRPRVLYRPDALPIAQLIVKALKGKMQKSSENQSQSSETSTDF